MTNVSPTSTPHNLGQAIDRLSHHWGRVVAFGVAMVILGVLAMILVDSATIASVLTIGFFMILGGVLEIALGFAARSWGRFFLWVAAGVLYIAAGIIAVDQPAMAAAFFTLLLGAAFIATGVLRLVLGFSLPSGRSKNLVLFSSAITFFLGILIIAGWPGNSVFVLGTLLAIDLIFYGASWITFGLGLKNRFRPG